MEDAVRKEAFMCAVELEMAENVKFSTSAKADIIEKFMKNSLSVAPVSEPEPVAWTSSKNFTKGKLFQYGDLPITQSEGAPVSARNPARSGGWSWGNADTPLFTSPPDLADEIARLREIAEAARGLCFGADWNNGNHVKLHGYREKLIRAVAAMYPDHPCARAALADQKGGAA